MTKLFLVCQDVDLGYHVYAICSTREKAEQFIEDYFAQRLLAWEIQLKDRFMQSKKTKEEPYFLLRPEKEEMGFFIEERYMDELASL